MLKLQQISNWWLSEQLTSLCQVERSWLFVVLCFFVRHQDCERMSWNNEVIIRLCWIILFWRKVRPNMKASFTTLTPQDFNVTIAIFCEQEDEDHDDFLKYAWNFLQIPVCMYYLKIYEINNCVIQLYVTRFLREPQIGTQWWASQWYRRCLGLTSESIHKPGIMPLGSDWKWRDVLLPNISTVSMHFLCLGDQ